MCGEKPFLFYGGSSDSGSSPRVRGKVFGRVRCYRAVGITPACAGKRRRPPDTSPARWDHPRVCGEKHAVPVSLMWSAGSPPRVRGKGLLEVFVPEPLRITPAYAGKSAAQSLDRLCAGDHPRVCGEKARTLIVQDEPQGLPPRMRGKVSGQKLWMVLCGITPAYAGKRP